jgi:site-specific DNA-cytosine methylase
MSTGTATDLFCGAGGMTLAAQWAGVQVRLAVDRWSVALQTHAANHPQTEQVHADLAEADPRQFWRTDVLLASPPCTAFSVAAGRRRRSGQQPLPFVEAALPEDEEEARAWRHTQELLWVPLRWAAVHRYSFVLIENVPEVVAWHHWRTWLQAWRALGYFPQLLSCNSQWVTAQCRDRLFVLFCRRAIPPLSLRLPATCSQCGPVEAVQAWRDPLRPWGRYGRQYRYGCPQCARPVEPRRGSAAEIIEWSLPLHSLQDLCPRTQARLCAQLAAARDGQGAWIWSFYRTGRLQPLSHPLPTVTCRARHALLVLREGAPTVRMLHWRELRAAMGFPASYQLLGTQQEKIAQLGNAVTPPVVAWLVRQLLDRFSGAGAATKEDR